MMVHAKNYETTSTFVKVMQKKPWPLFFRTRCTSTQATSTSTSTWICTASTCQVCKCRPTQKH